MDRGALAMNAEGHGPLGLGILSWHGYDTLRASLESYRQEPGFADLFDERVIYFPEITDQGRDLARDYGYRAAGAPENLGILEGFRGLAQSMTSDTIVMVENDCPLIETGDNIRRQLTRAQSLLVDGSADVVRLRSRRDPGEAFDTVDKYARVYPEEGAAFSSKFKARMIRLLRPGKARRLIGTAVYVEEAPEEKFPNMIKRIENDFFLVPTSVMTWTNQSIMINREFFLDSIIARADAVEGRRTVNNFKNLEIQMNDRWWRTRGWTVAVAPGLFTHRRLGHRGY